MSALDTIRTAFPEIADLTEYPDTSLQNWNAVAVVILDATRWASLYVLGCQLFIIHNLVLEKRNRDIAAVGGAVGDASGVMTAKQVDKVYASFDPKFGLLENAGHFNLTTYGVRFLQLARMFGSGGVQL